MVNDLTIVISLLKYDTGNFLGFSHYRGGLVSVAHVDNVAITGALIADQWNFFAATYDADTETLVHYINGVEVAQLTDLVLASTGGGAAPVLIGSPGAGIMDDVKIYSYALDAVEIAQEHSDISGLDTCWNRPFMDVAPEGALDCIVDLQDFAVIASEWLDDGNTYDQTL